MNSKLWLKNYDDGIPPSLEPYPRQTLIDLMRETAGLRPDHPALLFKGTTLTYSELDRLSDDLAAGLIANGLDKGDRVAILMANTPQYVIAEFAIWKAGGIVASINPLYTGFELEHALNECGAEMAMVMTLFYDKVAALREKTGIRRIIATSIKEYLPPVLRLLFTLLKEKKEGHRIFLQPGDLWFQDLLKQQAGAGPPPLSVLPEDERPHPLHRRHNRPLQSRGQLASGAGHVGSPGPRLVPKYPAGIRRFIPDSPAAVPRLRGGRNPERRHGHSRQHGPGSQPPRPG